MEYPHRIWSLRLLCFLPILFFLIVMAVSCIHDLFLQTLYMMAIAVLLHEFAHAVVAKKLGFPVREVCYGVGKLITSYTEDDILHTVRLFPFSFAIRFGEGDVSKPQYLPNKIKIAGAGPLASLAIALSIAAILGMVIGIPATPGDSSSFSLATSPSRTVRSERVSQPIFDALISGVNTVWRQTTKPRFLSDLVRIRSNQKLAGRPVNTPIESRPSDEQPPLVNILQRLMVFSLFIGLINLLPFLPFDAGKMRSVLRTINMRRQIRLLA